MLFSTIVLNSVKTYTGIIMFQGSLLYRHRLQQNNTEKAYIKMTCFCRSRDWLFEHRKLVQASTCTTSYWILPRTCRQKCENLYAKGILYEQLYWRDSTSLFLYLHHYIHFLRGSRLCVSLWVASETIRIIFHSNFIVTIIELKDPMDPCVSPITEAQWRI